MVKKFIFSLLMCVTSVTLPAVTPFVLTVKMHVVGPITPIKGGHPRMPTNVPSVYYDGNAITLPECYQESEFQIWQDGEQLYSVYIPVGISEITLPEGLSNENEIEIRFCTNEHTYIGYIEMPCE